MHDPASGRSKKYQRREDEDTILRRWEQAGVCQRQQVDAVERCLLAEFLQNGIYVLFGITE